MLPLQSTMELHKSFCNQIFVYNSVLVFSFALYGSMNIKRPKGKKQIPSTHAINLGLNVWCTCRVFFCSPSNKLTIISDSNEKFVSWLVTKILFSLIRVKPIADNFLEIVSKLTLLSNSFWKIPENIKVAWKTISYLCCLG